MLTAAEVEFFHKQGYLAPVGIVPAVEADRYREQFDALEAQEGHEITRIGLLDRHRDVDFVMELATRPAILDCIEAMIGPDMLLLATHFFCKYGQEEKFVAWHQDVTYWGLEPPQAITAWYAIDNADRENGCMRIIPGSHAGGIREHGKSDRHGNLLSINQEVPVTPDEEASAVDLELRAGEISLHDGALIHGSLPNRSDRRRAGLTLRYISPSVRPVAMNSLGKRWHPLLVRGQDRPGHFGTTH